MQIAKLHPTRYEDGVQLRALHCSKRRTCSSPAVGQQADHYPERVLMSDGFRSGKISVIAICMLFSTTACAGIGGGPALELGQGESTLRACPENEPLNVETLKTSDMPSCEPVNRELVFPDNERVPLGGEDTAGGGVAGTDSDYWYAYQYVGNWGLVAARARTDCSSIEEWGNPEALRRVHEAFGKRWACP